MAIELGSLGASAITETAEWEARCVNVPGAPSTSSYPGSAVMGASSDTYYGAVTSMSDITNRTLTLTCLTYTMTKNSKTCESIVYNNTGTNSWQISGTIGEVEYKMVASTTLYTTLNVSGNVTR